jgi:phage baseplate assembly protein W
MNINIKFPLSDDTQTNNYFRLNKVSKDAFTSNLLLLFLTEKGERYYQPDFGTNLLKYIFEPNDNTNTSDIIKDLKSTVTKYIPNLKIDDVKFNYLDKDGRIVLEGDGDTLNVSIQFTYSESGFTESGVLNINF